jgi:thiol:disulfide interchange protein
MNFTIMQRYYSLFIALVFSTVLGISNSSAQIVDPVQWKFTATNVNDEEVDITATASIEPKWHVYALKVSNDPNAIGPIPTELKLTAASTYTKSGGTKEGLKYITHFDPNFEMDLNYFENKAVFIQRIKRKSPAAFELAGVLEYMACDESKCIFPDPVKFTVKIVEVGAKEVVEEEVSTTVADATSGILAPVKWSVNSVKVEEGIYDIIFTANIDQNWHLYSQFLPSNEGPVATTFKMDLPANVQLVEGVKEETPTKKYDPNFMIDVNFFSGKTSFTQRVKVTDNKAPEVKASVNFMVCDDKKCLPPTDVNFKVNLATGTGEVFDPLQGNASSTTSGKFQYKLDGVDVSEPLVKNCVEIVAAPDASLWELFILGFLGGLVALLTPCVFPMIPLTVSFFTKGSENKKQGIIRAITYGLFIFGIYLLLSLPFHLFDQIDENILNNISTNVPLNVAFFIIFVVFAISFFGYFEITLPSGFANKMDNASNVGGLIGTFFMAVTLAIVSFSCTGPILGSLLAGSLAKDGGAIQLTAGMGGFGLALGIPFAIFAAFPGMLKSLPKSGGWLNSVKVVLGFLELALALKFLSQADLVDHWGILKYELFVGLWVVIFALMALYIFGKIKFPHDSPLKKLSIFRIGFGVLVISWVIYLASGFRYDERYNTYHSLTLLSGLAPPVGYSWMYPKDCPHNLDCEHDYQLAIERAQRENKPLFVDFTGYACVNCRKMEEHVWIDPTILEKLSEEFIVVSLYVDDRKELPAELQETYTYEVNGVKKTKEIKTYGDRWAAFQIASFNSNAQPLYAILSPDGKLLNTPVGYTPEIAEYDTWLQCGLDAFKNK